MKPTFEKTVDILVKAYLNDTLQHGDCSACAVGNIVHAAGIPKSQGDSLMRGHNNAWKWCFYTDDDAGKQTVNFADDTELFMKGLEVIRATGYDWKQLAKVEFAFEMAPKGEDINEWMFNGLMAVVDVLAEIHNVDLSVRESAKLQFVKP